MSDALIMYSLGDCPTCEKARRELAEQGVPFEERPVDASADHQRDVLRLTMQRTVPVFVKGSRVVVGWYGEHG